MLKLSRPNISDDELELVSSVLMSGDLVQGKVVELFEREITELTESRYAVVVSSGTAALYLSLCALEIGKGDAVIVPAFSFPATANVVEMVGAEVIFAEVDKRTACVSIETVKDAFKRYSGSNTIKAIMPVHEFGFPSEMEEIVKFSDSNNLVVVEDAACAIGATNKGVHVGRFGDTGCFSFHPRKILTCGEGGAIITDSKQLQDKLRCLRNHGISYTDGKPKFKYCALNFRMTDIQAAIGLAQIKKLRGAIKKRGLLAAIYHQELADLEPYILLPSDCPGRVWQTFFIIVDPNHLNRDLLVQHLAENDFQASIGAHCIPMLESFLTYENYTSTTPIAKSLYLNGLAIPLSEQYSVDDVRNVSSAVREYVRSFK